MQSRLSILLLTGFALGAPLQLSAQVPVDENGAPLVALDGNVDVENVLNDIPEMTSAELEELVGPVALYPDDLLAIVLPGIDLSPRDRAGRTFPRRVRSRQFARAG